MAQLIATTDVKSVKLICKEKGNIQKIYTEKFLYIKELLTPEAYKIFAQPVFKSNQKIHWDTEFEGKIYPISRANEVLEDFLVLENYVRNIYTYALLKAKTIEEKKKIVSLLDYLFTIRTIDDVYLIVSDDNKYNFCFTNWCQNEREEVNPVAGLFNPKAVDVVFNITLAEKPASEYAVWVKIGDEIKKYVSDENGKIIIKNLELLSEIELIQKDDKGKEVKKQKFIIDRQVFEFALEQVNFIKLLLKVVDKENKPLPNTAVNVIIDDKEQILTSDNDGIIQLGEVRFGSKLVVEQKITDSRKITRTYSISKDTKSPLIFHGERLSGKFFIVKVIDANNQPFEGATLEIINGEKRLIRNTSKDGIAIINDVLSSEKIIIRHLVGKSAVAQRTVDYDEEREIIFKTHITQTERKDIKIKILRGEQPITNLAVKLTTEEDWKHTVTDDKGEGVFLDVDCSSGILIEFTYNGRNYSYNFNCEDEIEINLKPKIKSGNKKIWWLAAGVVVFIVLAYLGFSNMNFKPKVVETPPEVKDTVKVIKKKPVFKPYTAKVLLVYKHNKFPIPKANIYLELGDSQRALKYDSGYFKVDIKQQKPLKFKIQLPDNKELVQEFLPQPVDTIFITIADVIIANDTTCGVNIYKQGVRTYIQTFRFPSKVSKIRFRFKKYYHSDQVKIYYGSAKDISPNKLLKDMVIYSDTVRYMINLPQPDSLITFEITAGEPNFPVWSLKIYCK